MDKIKIAIVENDIDRLKMIQTFLNAEKEFVVTGIAINKHDAIQLAKAVDIDIIIVGIGVNNWTDGLQATAEIRHFSRTKIIIYSALEDPEIVIESFTAGAINFLPTDKLQNIPELIKELSTKLTPLEILLQDYQRLKRKEQLAVLSGAEFEIFTLLEDGLTQREIALKLIKSEDTVKTQVTSILRKLEVHSVKEARKKVSFKG
ncbi:MAG TPA: response regulator transcription factor [Bacillota bacterium]|nr:response regulator transcription factor [Bacillota bacterium]